MFFLGEIDFSVENVSTDACDALEIRNEGLIFPKFPMYCILVVEFSDAYREERINTGLKR